MSKFQEISGDLLAIANLPPEKRNSALSDLSVVIQGWADYEIAQEQKDLISSIIKDLIAENDAEQIAKSKLVFVEDVEEQIAPTKKTRAKKIVKPVGEDLPDFIDSFSFVKDLPEPIKKLIGLRRKQLGTKTSIDFDDKISNVLDWYKSSEGIDFWSKMHNEGDLREFKKLYGNKGEKIDDLIEFAELNDFVEGLTQPIASGDLPDTIRKSESIRDLPEPVKKLAIFRNEQQGDKIDLSNTLGQQLRWNKTPEGEDFWRKIHEKGDLTEFKRIYGNKGKGVDAIIDELIGFNELLELADKKNAPAPAVKTRKPRTPKVAPVVAPVVTTQKLLFLRLIFNPPVGSAIKLEVYNPEELHYAIIGILNKLDVVSLFFNFEAVTDFSSYLTKEKIYYHNEPIEIVEKLIETFDKFVTPELDWSDFVDNATDVLRINDNKKELDDAFEKHKKPAPIIIPKPVKVVTPKVVAPKVVTPKPVKVVAPKVVKTKVTKPKVEDDLSFLDDLNNIF